MFRLARQHAHPWHAVFRADLCNCRTGIGQSTQPIDESGATGSPAVGADKRLRPGSLQLSTSLRDRAIVAGKAMMVADKFPSQFV
jgi:hypothetical protein